MKNFCVQTIELPAVLRADHGVVHAVSLRATTDAGEAAAHIVAQARQQAGVLQAAAQRDAQQAVRREQEEVARHATHLLHGLQRAQHEMLARIDGLVIALAQEAFDRLVLELTPRERIAAMLRRILQEAPNKLVAAVLAVHPDDIGVIAETGAADRGGWELRSEPALAPGTCRLEAASGEWRAEFQLAVDALRAALGDAADVFSTPAKNGVINLENLNGDEEDAIATH